MGKIGVRTTETEDSAGNPLPMVMWAPRANSFTLALASEKQEKRAWLSGKCGSTEIVDTVVTGETWTLRLGFQSFDQTDISVLMDEVSRISPTSIFPEVNSGVGGQPIACPGMAGTPNAAAVVIDKKYKGRRTLNSGEFAVGGGSITVTKGDAADMAVAVMYDRQYSGAETIGLGENPIEWGELCFSGVACGPRFPQPMSIYVPSMDRSGNFDLSIGDDTNVELEFTPKIKEPFRNPVLIRL